MIISTTSLLINVCIIIVLNKRIVKFKELNLVFFFSITSNGLEVIKIVHREFKHF